jgi:hypothetical protein
VSPVRYELSFYIPEDDILHSHSREHLKSYITLTGWTLQWRSNVSPVKYKLGFYISEDSSLHWDFRSCSCETNVVTFSPANAWKPNVELPYVPFSSYPELRRPLPSPLLHRASLSPTITCENDFESCSCVNACSCSLS